MNQEQKLDRFIASIFAEGEAAKKQFEEEIAQKRSEALTQAERQALQESYEYVHGQVEQIRAENGERISQAVISSRRTLSAKVTELACDVLAQTKARIAAFTASDAYPAALSALWKEMQPLLGKGAVTLYVRQEDMPLAQRLFAGQALEVGEFTLGGLIAVSENRRIDSSYDTALRDAFRRFSEEVADNEA